MPSNVAELPAKKQSKWSAEEDALIIDLRGGGMKWEDISKRLPGRSAISCRLHYQNYLERRSEWDEERKNKLARLYERFKSEMWAKIAEEMAVPWRAAEAMHWQLGEADMARRAGVVPFSLSSVTLDTTTGHSAHSNHRRSPPHGHSHSHSQGSTSSAGVTPSGLSSTPTRFHRTGFERGNAPSRSLAARRDSTPRSIPMTLPPSPGEGVMLAGIGNLMGRGGGGPQMLPSVSEMTTGVSPYNTPAYAVTATMGGGYSSPKPLLPSLGYAVPRPMATLPVVKRRASPDLGPRETSRRRQ